MIMGALTSPQTPSRLVMISTTTITTRMVTAHLHQQQQQQQLLAIKGVWDKQSQ
jgi:hypothetical protein